MGVKPVKVLQLIASTGIGGAERVLLDICNSLKSEQYRFEVCLLVLPDCEKESALGNILNERAIDLHYVEMRFPLSIFEILNLMKIFRTTNPSVVHCHGVRADVFGGIAARLCRIPAVSSVHGWIAFSKKMRFYKWLDLRFLRLFDMILPVSGQLQLELQQNGIPSRKIQLLRNVPSQNNGGERRSSNKSTRNHVTQLGFVGRLSHEKGITFLLEAVAQLKKVLPFKLHIVGDGPEMEKVLYEIKNLSLEEQVEVYGHLAYPQKVYDALDILVLPSLTEGIPLTLLEAMSLGIPVIASKVGGVPEIIENHQSGLIVEPGSVSDLTEKILLLAKDIDLQKRLGAAALKRIAAVCDHNKWEQTIMQVYQRRSKGDAV
jgi:glycosyltransferase involved in cell wall biosynthesis